MKYLLVLILMVGARAASRATPLTSTCAQKGYQFWGEYRSQRLVGEALESETKREALPNMWSAHQNFYQNVYIEMTKDLSDKKLSLVYWLEQKGRPQALKRKKIELGELETAAPSKLFNFAEYLPHAADFPLVLNIRVLSSGAALCEYKMTIASLD